MNNKPQLEQILKEICKHIGANTKAVMIRIPFQEAATDPKWTDCPLSKQALKDKGQYGTLDNWFAASPDQQPNDSWDFTIRVAMDFATDTCQAMVIIPENGDEWAKQLVCYKKATPNGVEANLGEIKDDVVAELVRYFPALKLAGKRYAEPLSDCEDDS